MIDSFNNILTSITDLSLYPFRGVPKLWGLLFLSVVSGVLLLLCYGVISNQNGIRNIKRKIVAALFESVLYRHNLRICLAAQLRMLVGAAVYFAYAVPPIIVLMIPCLLMLAQFNLRYETDGLKVGEPALVRVKVDNETYLDTISLTTSENVDVTPRLRVLEDNEVIWRITPQDQNLVTLEVSDGKNTYPQSVTVDNAMEAKIPAKQLKSPYVAVLYPGQALIPAESPISEIVIEYPSVSYKFCGIKWHWLVLFFVVSVLSGLLASKVFGIAV